MKKKILIGIFSFIIFLLLGIGIFIVNRDFPIEFKTEDVVKIIICGNENIEITSSKDINEIVECTKNFIVVSSGGPSEGEQVGSDKKRVIIVLKNGHSIFINSLGLYEIKEQNENRTLVDNTIYKCINFKIDSIINKIYEKYTK